MSGKNSAGGVAILAIALTVAMVSGVFLFLPEKQAVEKEQQLSPGPGEKPGAAPKKEPTPSVVAKVVEKAVEKKADLPAKQLDMKEYIDDKGRLVRVRVSEELGSKYPMIRSEETFSGKEAVGEAIDKVEMASDHILVKFSSEISDAEVSAMLEPLGMQIKEKKQLSGVYLMSLKEEGVDAVPRALEKLKTLKGIKHAGPDFLVRAEGRG